MSDTKDLITIVVPIKDEKENIARAIKNISKYVKPKHEILLIYDSEKDNTLPVAKKLQEKYKNFRLIKNDSGEGVLKAILKGFEASGGNILVMMAADGTDNPKTINTMYKKIKEGYDLVCPTRYSKGGKVVGKTTLKSILSRLSGVSTPYLLGIPTSDLTYSFKMFRKSILKDIKIESKGGFEFAEELLIKAHFNNFKITEVPTIWIDRVYGKSKFKLARWLPKYVYWYIWGISKRLLKTLS